MHDRKMKETLSAAQQGRRDFLEKAGKLAVYTSPTIMMLMYPGSHAFASGGPIRRNSLVGGFNPKFDGGPIRRKGHGDS
jgi:hypothetical protein